MSSAKVLFHSSIKITGEKTVYFDPFRISAAENDADIIFITHDHFDHFSPEDIEKAAKSDTILVVPKAMAKKAEKIADKSRVIAVEAGKSLEVCGIKAEVIPAYNIGKPFHPKSGGWVGYIVTLDGTRYYVAGDTDKTPESEKVRCDVALVPIGGHFTMDAKQAAELVNMIRPGKAIPTHYGEVAGKPEDAVIFEKLVDKGIEAEIQLYK